MLDQCLQEPPSYGQRHRLCIQLANEDLERITLSTCETIVTCAESDGVEVQS